MGRREKKLPLPTPLERKQQGERAKKGIKDEPIKKRAEHKGLILDEWGKGLEWDKLVFPEIKPQPGQIIQWGRQMGKTEMIYKHFKIGYDGVWQTNEVDEPKKKPEPKKTPTEEWLDNWEKGNELGQ